MSEDDIHPLDADLVAYLDGALAPAERERIAVALTHDPALAARLERLAAGSERLGMALDALPPVPPDLEAFLARALATAPPPPAARPARAAPFARLAGLLAGLGATPRAGFAAGLLGLALFLAGLGAGWQLRHVAAPAGLELAEEDEWREAVAQYLTFYTAETFADLPDDPARRAGELALVGARLGLDLAFPRAALDGLTFKRAQMFDYEGYPLAQLAFLDAKAGPVVLCIVTEPMPEALPRTEERHGLNIVYWSRGGRAFMLAGRLPMERMEALAGPLAERLDG